MIWSEPTAELTHSLLAAWRPLVGFSTIRRTLDAQYAIHDWWSAGWYCALALHHVRWLSRQRLQTMT